MRQFQVSTHLSRIVYCSTEAKVEFAEIRTEILYFSHSPALKFLPTPLRTTSNSYRSKFNVIAFPLTFFPSLLNMPVKSTKLRASRSAPPTANTASPSDGHALEGREVMICWEDGVWYNAVVVRYYPQHDEYKLVYRSDDGIEITSLANRRWVLAPKKRQTDYSHPVLDGCIIQFLYPKDKKTYRAMVYDYSEGGGKLKICYINEHCTDNLKGGGWQFITDSPCVEGRYKVRYKVSAQTVAERTKNYKPQIRKRRKREGRKYQVPQREVLKG